MGFSYQSVENQGGGVFNNQNQNLVLIKMNGQRTILISNVSQLPNILPRDEWNEQWADLQDYGERQVPDQLPQRATRSPIHPHRQYTAKS